MSKIFNANLFLKSAKIMYISANLQNFKGKVMLNIFYIRDPIKDLKIESIYIMFIYYYDNNQFQIFIISHNM